ncbi:type VII secretion integral membrane protein EccD [Xylanimonas allomyrinae]|uniref:Type VII secretion integral membrane protein EccD n=1 Tax=Xylanimonas allomyrinae TaxID=2509459 RepID=A0A4P6EI52_9MICO|nr:type VII secretion integral membrane protein EccD [Xylanimonas allomyrinae]QAY62172.1 type VII secretion integral membrane protein EccD [Xylanimonas allomyrinae]
MPTASVTADAVHVSVTCDDRRLDLTVPTHVPLLEMLPAVARGLGVLDPSSVHGGFAVQRTDGTRLDPGLDAHTLGLRDGELLTLVANAAAAERRRYDDVVEAVIDAVQAGASPWTARDQARTALGVSLTFLALGAAVLASTGPGTGIGPLVAWSGCAVLLVLCVTLTRTGQPEAGHGLGLAASVYGAVGAWLVLPAHTSVHWQAVAACAALVLVGAAALAGSGSGPQVHVIPVATGLALGGAEAFTALDGVTAVAALAVTVAVCGTTTNLLPWLTLASTRLQVTSPQSDAEILAAPPSVDPQDVARRTAEGHAVLGSLRIAGALVLLAATWTVAGSGPLGAALCALAFLGMLFTSRQVYARGQVRTLVVMATAGLTLTGAISALTGSVSRGVLLGVVLAAGAGVVALSVLGTGPRQRLSRLADAVELGCLAALLPLGVLAAGIA